MGGECEAGRGLGAGGRWLVVGGWLLVPGCSVSGEAIELGWLAAGFLPFLQRFYNAFLDDLAAEISLVEILAYYGLMHDLELAEGEFGRQKFEADIGVVELVAKALVRVFDNFAVIER